MSTTGPLGPHDELFIHQIPDTFASVSQSDPSWTEKVCAMAAARDGSLQIGFGMGKYVNRNVTDAYAGVAFGDENIVVRSTRSLAADPHATSVGPISYEVLEPLHSVRFVLEATDAQPISYDVTFESKLPPALEAQDTSRDPNGARVVANLARYHQIGVARGWVEVEGKRTEITPDTWISTRDHSWGVRYHVGAPAADMEPPYEMDKIEGLKWRFGWSPSLYETPSGGEYGIHFFFQNLSAFGMEQHKLTGGVEQPDGSVQRFAGVDPQLRYDPQTRRLLGGEIIFTMEDGSTRPISVEPLGDAGLHLGLGLYFGLDGHWHGAWRGQLEVDGERITDIGDPAILRRIHQVRDNMMRFDDPVGGGSGIGNFQSTIVGAWPELGLTQETSFF